MKTMLLITTSSKIDTLKFDNFCYQLLIQDFYNKCTLSRLFMEIFSYCLIQCIIGCFILFAHISLNVHLNISFYSCYLPTLHSPVAELYSMTFVLPRLTNSRDVMYPCIVHIFNLHLCLLSVSTCC